MVSDIQNFLYWHLQYALDGEKQLLRSPACSWVSRFQGIDCKSYSIFASTILLNAGISHYMRRIKQKGNPDAFTHVYVVVPIDQQSYDLSKEYYTIDGTIDISVKDELPRLDFDDVFLMARSKGISQTGLASPSMSLMASQEKRRALEMFINSVLVFERLSPENSDLHKLKSKVHQLISRGNYDVHFRVKDFSVWIDNECFTLWKEPIHGLGNAQLGQQLDDLIFQNELQS